MDDRVKKTSKKPTIVIRPNVCEFCGKGNDISAKYCCGCSHELTKNLLNRVKKVDLTAGDSSTDSIILDFYQNLEAILEGRGFSSMVGVELNGRGNTEIWVRFIESGYVFRHEVERFAVVDDDFGLLVGGKKVEEWGELILEWFENWQIFRKCPFRVLRRLDMVNEELCRKVDVLQWHNGDEWVDVPIVTEE